MEDVGEVATAAACVVLDSVSELVAQWGKLAYFDHPML